MPSIYQVKPAFQKALRPLVNTLARLGVTPNAITLLACIGSIAIGIVIATHPNSSEYLLLLPPFLFIRMALNAIDGMLAREHAMKSPLGAILNELTDPISDAALYLPLAVFSGFPTLTVLTFVVGALLTELCGLACANAGYSRRYDGPMGKSDRAFVIGAVALWVGCGMGGKSWLGAVLWLATGLEGVTIWNRARKALGEKVRYMPT